MKPDAFAAVMATGIVSIAALDHGFRVISDVFIVLAAVALPVLIAAAAVAWRRESWDVGDLGVSLRLCTYVAACAVVAARLADHQIVLWVLQWSDGACGVIKACGYATVRAVARK